MSTKKTTETKSLTVLIYILWVVRGEISKYRHNPFQNEWIEFQIHHWSHCIPTVFKVRFKLGIQTKVQIWNQSTLTIVKIKVLLPNYSSLGKKKKNYRQYRKMTLKFKILPSFVTLFMILVVGFFSNVISKWLISSAYSVFTALQMYKAILWWVYTLKDEKLWINNVLWP